MDFYSQYRNITGYEFGQFSNNRDKNIIIPSRNNRINVYFCWFGDVMAVCSLEPQTPTSSNVGARNILCESGSEVPKMI